MLRSRARSCRLRSARIHAAYCSALPSRTRRWHVSTSSGHAFDERHAARSSSWTTGSTSSFDERSACSTRSTTYFGGRRSSRTSRAAVSAGTRVRTRTRSRRRSARRALPTSFSLSSSGATSMWSIPASSAAWTVRVSSDESTPRRAERAREMSPTPTVRPCQ